MLILCLWDTTERKQNINIFNYYVKLWSTTVIFILYVYILVVYINSLKTILYVYYIFKF